MSHDECQILQLSITDEDVQTAEDILDQRLEEGLEDEQPIESIEPMCDKIPKVFTSLEDWPIATNICCQNCLNQFKKRPCFIALTVQQKDETLYIEVEGNFCDFACAANQIDLRYPSKVYGSKNSQLKTNLCILYNIFNGVKIYFITPVDNYLLLRIFGGNLSGEEYKKIIEYRNTIKDFTMNGPNLKGVPIRTKPKHKSVAEILHERKMKKETVINESAGFAALTALWK
jgi:hypothetical protein